MSLEDTSFRQRIDGVGSVLTSGDADRLSDLYTGDGQLMPPGGEFVRGREAIVEFWRGVVESGVETVDIETVELEDHGDTALRVGRATLHDADGTTLDDVKFIETWEREDGEWRIHHDIWNSNLPDEQ